VQIAVAIDGRRLPNSWKSKPYNSNLESCAKTYLVARYILAQWFDFHAFLRISNFDFHNLDENQEKWSKLTFEIPYPSIIDQNSLKSLC
jgi:hypothetical protein